MALSRRRILGFMTILTMSGCSEIESLLPDSSNQLGDTVAFDEVEVTVRDHATTDTLILIFETLDGDRETKVEAPPGGVIALFEIHATNTDITDRPAPAVNTENYDQMEEGENEVVLTGINSIRVYGSGEGGHFPEGELGSAPLYDKLKFDGETVPGYPTKQGSNDTTLEAGEEISGWVFGFIESGADPQLRIKYNGTDVMWTV